MNDPVSTHDPFGAPVPADIESGSELSRLLGIISASRVLVLGIAAAVFVAGLLYSYLRTPIYQAATTIQVLQKSGGLTGLEQLSSMVQGTALPTQTEIQLIQTRAVLGPVVDKLGLNIKVDGSSLLHRLFHRRKPVAKVAVFEVPASLEGQPFTVKPKGDGYQLFDPDGVEVLEGKVGTAAAGKVDTPSGPAIVNLRIDSIPAKTGSFTITRIPMDQAVKGLLASLQTGELGQQTGIVQVTLQGTSPTFIARELNAIAQSNVRQNVRQNSTQAARQLDFLNSQVPELERRLEKAQAKLASFLSSRPTLALSQNTQYLVGRVSALEQAIGPLEAQVAQAKAAMGASNPQLTALEVQLQVLKKQRSQLLDGAAKLPKDEQTLIRLQSDVTINQDLYSAMLNQIQGLQIAKAGTIGDVFILDPAIVPAVPVLPDHALDALVALIIGLLFGVAAAFGRRALNQSVEDPEVLEDKLGLPVLAVVPHSRAQRRLTKAAAQLPSGVPHLLCAYEGADEAALEALRSLRTSLQLALSASEKQLLCVASLGPSEGKTFVSTNLAYLIAQAGKKVLLVDGDLRRGHIHRSFGWPRGQGFAEFLRDEVSLAEAVRETGLSTLQVMSTGTLPVDAANLLTNADIGLAIGDMMTRYDWVIMDTPPILAVSDSILLTRHATSNLLLLKHGLHSLRQVRLALKRYARHDISFSGCILNDVSASARRYAYRQYGYEYQYSYKDRRKAG